MIVWSHKCFCCFPINKSLQNPSSCSINLLEWLPGSRKPFRFTGLLQRLCKEHRWKEKIYGMKTREVAWHILPCPFQGCYPQEISTCIASACLPSSICSGWWSWRCCISDANSWGRGNPARSMCFSMCLVLCILPSSCMETRDPLE